MDSLRALSWDWCTLIFTSGTVRSSAASADDTKLSSAVTTEGWDAIQRDKTEM